jgi:dihydrofolate reductase
MEITLIAAMAAGRVIGKDNAMPWHLPADLRHFKALTLGKPVVMGRKTFESLGRPLPGRHNIVVSRNPQLQLEGITVVATPEQAIVAAGDVAELMIIGGAQIYRQFLPLATRLELIELQVEGDTHFPAYDDGSWQQVSSEQLAPDANNPHPCQFIRLERR